MGPGMRGKRWALHLKFYIIAGVPAVQFLVTFSKNICSKLRLLTRFLEGRTRMCEKLLTGVGGDPSEPLT